MQTPFAVWITGLPASGKSTLAAALGAQLRDAGVIFAVLESDEVRKFLTPSPTYSDAERDLFYRALAYMGRLLTEHGVCAIIDATAHRRAWRARGRELITRFFEVYVDCPQAVCVQRDPKGIYRRGRDAPDGTVPGTQEPYEKPHHPDLVVHGDRDDPAEAARQIAQMLTERGWLSSRQE